MGGTAGTAVAVVDALYLAALVDGHRPRDSCPYCRGDEPHRSLLPYRRGFAEASGELDTHIKVRDSYPSGEVYEAVSTLATGIKLELYKTQKVSVVVELRVWTRSACERGISLSAK